LPTSSRKTNPVVEVARELKEGEVALSLLEVAEAVVEEEPTLNVAHKVDAQDSVQMSSRTKKAEEICSKPREPAT
jgi:hypothetical protein